MRSSYKTTVLVTGTTGFLGHYILAELLARGCRCVVLLRPPIEISLTRLANLLAELDVDGEQCIEEGSIEPVCGELPDTLPPLRIDSSAVLIHTAAATNFRRNARGDPERTNVDGTRALLEWAGSLGVRRLHLVSSAYTCGRTSQPAAEVFLSDPAATRKRAGSPQRLRAQQVGVRATGHRVGS